MAEPERHQPQQSPWRPELRRTGRVGLAERRKPLSVPSKAPLDPGLKPNARLSDRVPALSHLHVVSRPHLAPVSKLPGRLSVLWIKQRYVLHIALEYVYSCSKGHRACAPPER